MKPKKSNPYTPKVKPNDFPKFGKPVKLTKRIDPVVRMVTPRETQHFPSLPISSGSGTLKESPKYTGSSMLGISIVHKSCLQPVFSQEQAIENAKMRR